MGARRRRSRRSARRDPRAPPGALGAARRHGGGRGAPRGGQAASRARRQLGAAVRGGASALPPKRAGRAHPPARVRRRALTAGLFEDAYEALSELAGRRRGSRRAPPAGDGPGRDRAPDRPQRQAHARLTSASTNCPTRRRRRRSALMAEIGIDASSAWTTPDEGFSEPRARGGGRSAREQAATRRGAGFGTCSKRVGGAPAAIAEAAELVDAMRTTARPLPAGPQQPRLAELYFDRYDDAERHERPLARHGRCHRAGPFLPPLFWGSVIGRPRPPEGGGGAPGEAIEVARVPGRAGPGWNLGGRVLTAPPSGTRRPRSPPPRRRSRPQDRHRGADLPGDVDTVV